MATIHVQRHNITRLIHSLDKGTARGLIGHGLRYDTKRVSDEALGCAAMPRLMVDSWTDRENGTHYSHTYPLKRSGMLMWRLITHQSVIRRGSAGMGCMRNCPGTNPRHMTKLDLFDYMLLAKSNSTHKPVFKYLLIFISLLA
jgi:hypothetical protein